MFFNKNKGKNEEEEAVSEVSMDEIDEEIMAELGLNEIVDQEEPELNTEYKDYNKVFPGVFLSEKDIIRGPSVAKLRGEELKIMR